MDEAAVTEAQTEGQTDRRSEVSSPDRGMVGVLSINCHSLPLAPIPFMSSE